LTARSTIRRPDVGANLAWLIGQLWEREEQAGKVHVSVDGTVPGGYRPVERFAVMPELRRARFLVPLRSRRAAWASTARYNALRPAPVRLSRAVIGAGMRTGLAQRLPLDRLVICLADDTDPKALPRLLLGAHLRELLCGQEVAMGIGIGDAAPNRKPTLQLFGLDGRGLGYAKLGWNELTRQLVGNEIRALQVLANHPLRHLSVPRLLTCGRWNGLELAVTAPLPAGVRHHRPGRVPPLEITREIAGIHGTHTLPLAASPYWARIRRLVAQTADGADRLSAALRRYQGYLEQRCGATVLTFGSWHGDWVPWNLAWQRGRLFAWDWEHSGEHAPLGFDLLHWTFQLAFVLERRGPSEGMARCLRQAVPELVKLGVAESAARDTAAVYLLELASGRTGPARPAGGRTPRPRARRHAGAPGASTPARRHVPDPGPRRRRRRWPCRPRTPAARRAGIPRCLDCPRALR
jgi:hypothetical protein